MSDNRLDFPSARRNAGPILQVLQEHLPAQPCDVLEIASGSGQHAVHFTAAMPQLRWWPSDIAPEHMASIEAWRAHAPAQERIGPAQCIDVCSAAWTKGHRLAAGPEHFDAIVNVNMIHIAPWAATSGLMRGAAHRLRPGAMLILYGPFMRGGRHTAPSNEAFDQSLRARNALWGVRDLERVSALASQEGLALTRTIAMPANNFCVLFTRA